MITIKSYLYQYGNVVKEMVMIKVISPPFSAPMSLLSFYTEVALNDPILSNFYVSNLLLLYPLSQYLHNNCLSCVPPTPVQIPNIPKQIHRQYPHVVQFKVVEEDSFCVGGVVWACIGWRQLLLVLIISREFVISLS